jgi:phage gp36-like protein
MSYTTQQQLVDRYGAAMLTDLTERGDPPLAEIDADVVARAIADTDALIDGYLAGRYQLPLASVPPLLSDLGQAIAVYKLHRNTASDKVQRDYDGALKSLRDIAAGVIRLNVAGIEPAGSASNQVQMSGPARLTREDLEGFV